MDLPIPHSRPFYDQRDEERVVECLRSGFTALGGPASKELACRLASTYSAHAVELTGSGKSALALSLIAAGVRHGGEVILPSYVCPEVLYAVISVGAVPVLCDIEEETFSCSAQIVEPLLTHLTQAIVVPHMFGIPNDVTHLLGLGVPIIEDVAQSMGALIRDGHPVGSQGFATVLSFKSIKMLGAGEGGAAVIRAADGARALSEESDRIDCLCHTPMSDLTASLCLSQLDKLEAFVNRRITIAKGYLAALKGTSVNLPRDIQGSSWFRFPIRKIGRPFSIIRDQFLAEGVHVRMPVDAVLHRTHPHLLRGKSFPVTDLTYGDTVSIPIYPALGSEHINHVINACKTVFGHN